MSGVKRSQTPEAIAYQKAYYEAHKEKVKADEKARREADPEAYNAKQNARRAASPEKFRAYDNARDKDARNARQRERAAEKRANGIKRIRNDYDPIMSTIYKARRRARELGAPGSYTKAQILTMFDAQNGQCVYCKTSLHNGYHKDHIKALARGGSNDISNIQLLCQPCNNRKHARDADEFAAMIAAELAIGHLASGGAPARTKDSINAEAVERILSRLVSRV